MKEGSLAYLEQLLRHAPWLGGDEEKEVPYTTAALAGIEGSIPVSSWSTSEVVVLLLVLCIVLLMGYDFSVDIYYNFSNVFFFFPLKKA